MQQIAPIDDYIEPLIALKSHVARIEKHLMHSDCNSAVKELESSEAAMIKLRKWCWKHCGDNTEVSGAGTASA